MDDAITVLENAHKSQGEGRAVNDPRRRLRAPHGSVAIMPGGDAETGFLGFKTAFYAAGAVHVLLYDMTSESSPPSSRPDGLARYAPALRAALPQNTWRVRMQAQTVGIIGVGTQAHTQVAAVCAVRNVSRVLAYGRDEGRRNQSPSA